MDSDPPAARFDAATPDAHRRVTVLGASGFIGRALCDHLGRQGWWVLAPGRDWSSLWEHNLGHVIYAVGLTADFRHRLPDTMEAHVCRLLEVLRRGRFDSLLYLSSTRVYGHSVDAHEDTPLQAHPADASDLYNLSKLAGESLCLTDIRPQVRVARLSNVYGPGMAPEVFLAAILGEALRSGKVVFRTSPETARDYVALEDVVSVLLPLALQGRHRLYNVAAGVNVDNRTLATLIRQQTGAETLFAEDAAPIVFPPISVERLAADLPWIPVSLEQRFADLVAGIRETAIPSSVPGD